MSVCDIVLKNGLVLTNTLTYDQFMSLFRTGMYGDQEVASVEVKQKHNDKGPNRIIFE